MVIQAKDDRTKRSDLGLDEKRIVDLVERLKPLLDRIDALPRRGQYPTNVSSTICGKRAMTDVPLYVSAVTSMFPGKLYRGNA